MTDEGDNPGRKILVDPAYYLEDKVNSEGVGNVATEDKGEDEPRGIDGGFTVMLVIRGQPVIATTAVVKAVRVLVEGVI
ncbi:hypothetical protein Tco_1557990 [Tanacetum coccineum]